jgi:WD40 repeat protein
MADKTTSGRARACAYSPDGVYLAVSFGCGAKNKQNKKLAEDGMIRIYRQGSDPANPALPTLVKVSELKEAKQWISVLKFSPDGNTLAAGSRDNSIYLYSVSQMFKRKAKFSKHNAGKPTNVELSALLTFCDVMLLLPGINQLDFSADGRYLQSCCSGYEILFSEVNTGTQVTNGATQFLGVYFRMQNI